MALRAGPSTAVSRSALRASESASALAGSKSTNRVPWTVHQAPAEVPGPSHFVRSDALSAPHNQPIGSRPRVTERLHGRGVLLAMIQPWQAAHRPAADAKCTSLLLERN